MGNNKSSKRRQQTQPKSVRSWLTYLNLRLHKHTQKEHRLIAEEIRDIFVEKFPIISKVFDNFKTAYEQQFI